VTAQHLFPLPKLTSVLLSGMLADEIGVSMLANVIAFPRQPLGQYVRIGHAFRQLEFLFKSGRLPVRRAVFEASHVAQQTDFLRDLAGEGVELVLDTNVAELSAEGRFAGAVRGAPWAIEGRPLGVDDFRRAARNELADKIANLAVPHGFDAVISPSHLLTGVVDPWLDIDRRMIEALRAALDRAGGHSIAIDFELIIPYAMLRDQDARMRLRTLLADEPFENLWFRVSGIGRESTGMAIKRYIDALRDCIPSKGSIIVDNIAGLGALATLAFGAAGGVAHGVGDHERFSADGWNKAPTDGGGGGNARKVLISAIDRQLKLSELVEIEKASGGRRLFACTDTHCCPRGIADMYEHERAHYAYQRNKQISDLSRISAPGRADYFVSKMLRPAEVGARAATRLKLENESLRAALKRDSERIDRMSVLFENEAATSANFQRVREPSLRKASTSSQSVRR